MQKKLAFVGCRPERLPFGEDERTASAIRLKALLLNEIMQRVEEGYDTFLTGAMRGGDILFAEQLLLVKALTYPHIRLITVVSYKGQADGWSEMWRERYNRILDYSEEVITLSERYNGGCYHARNRHMVDKADVFLALHSGGMAGEAAYVIRYARQKCKEVIQINPDTMERREVLPQAE